MTWKPWALFGLSLLLFALVLKSQSLGVALPLSAGLFLLRFGIWAIYRVARGWLRLKDHQPMPA